MKNFIFPFLILLALMPRTAHASDDLTASIVAEMTVMKLQTELIQEEMRRIRDYIDNTQKNYKSLHKQEDSTFVALCTVPDCIIEYVVKIGAIVTEGIEIVQNYNKCLDILNNAYAPEKYPDTKDNFKRQFRTTLKATTVIITDAASVITGGVKRNKKGEVTGGVVLNAEQRLSQLNLILKQLRKVNHELRTFAASASIDDFSDSMTAFALKNITEIVNSVSKEKTP